MHLLTPNTCYSTFSSGVPALEIQSSKTRTEQTSAMPARKQLIQHVTLPYNAVGYNRWWRKHLC